MPTYDYQCRTCGHRFEVFQSMSAHPLTTCPSAECIMEEPVKGTGEVRRMISGGAGLVFKGEGFYLTDYVRKKSSGGDDKGSNAPKASDTSTSTSSPSTSTTSNSSTSE